MNIDNIVLDKEYTYAYHDTYNEQCQCAQCNVFRNKFQNEYPDVVNFLSRFGIDIRFPIEIMDFGIDNKSLKRMYMVYYAVKGHLPKPMMTSSIGTVIAVLRNDEISAEAYSNTGMEKPFFIVELSDILISDNVSVFIDAIDTGREIEFHCYNKNYFLSRESNVKWYIYCEQDKQKQIFSSKEDLLSSAIINDIKINLIWDKINIDFLL